ncbi:hypothetical protein Bca52824_011205 [Brassica carinata]|uniref:Uncharacterized protein n=1 Tax=Brassica carinata TaxID=52824 RepID=A0A8X8BBF7_BRACI|nr:hypothetical protein Bca52824_011205 [Brassica carinata]
MGSVAAASQISEEVISRLLEIKLSANVVFAKTVDQKGQAFVRYFVSSDEDGNFYIVGWKTRQMKLLKTMHLSTRLGRVELNLHLANVHADPMSKPRAEPKSGENAAADEQEPPHRPCMGESKLNAGASDRISPMDIDKTASIQMMEPPPIPANNSTNSAGVAPVHIVQPNSDN